jgi:dienelactone hydrolase
VCGPGPQVTMARSFGTRRIAVGFASCLFLCAVGAVAAERDSRSGRAPGATSVTIPSLEDLSIQALRARHYASDLRVVTRLGSSPRTFMAKYSSDGLRMYTRIDVPASPAPAQGYPVVIFLHGWLSNDTAAAFDFAQREDSQYRHVIETFVAAGFVVVYPGWRGYGTVHGKRADGAEFLAAWNNESYLSPVFFAIDTLNLLDGLGTLDQTDWRNWGFPSAHAVSIDLSQVHIAGHSQGGDVVLTVLAVAGEGSNVRTRIATGSIWAGCFPSRFVQLETYGPMQATLEAFMSGDGGWTGTATGRDGRVNPRFVFGWPPDWIETVDPASPEWTWQAKTWSVPTVTEVLQRKYGEMYATLNSNVANLGDARFELTVDAAGKVNVTHDPRVAAAMGQIGGFDFPQYLTEPLALHFSDQDFYSTSAWNQDLSRRITAAGGRSVAYAYPGNTHGLERSKHSWFSGPDVVPGFDRMLARDVALFHAHAPSAKGGPMEVK